jgi:hypothetical protein
VSEFVKKHAEKDQAGKEDGVECGCWALFFPGKNSGP